MILTIDSKEFQIKGSTLSINQVDYVNSQEDLEHHLDFLLEVYGEKNVFNYLRRVTNE